MSVNKFTWNGKQYTVPKLAKELNVPPRTLYGRIKKLGLEKAVEVSRMSEAEYKQHLSTLIKKSCGGERRDLWTFEYRGKSYSREALAKLLGVNHSTFQGWIVRFGRDGAIELAETPKSDRREKMAMLSKGSPYVKKSKVDEFELPDCDPDFELKNRARHWVKNYGIDGAMAKASLRI